MTQGEHLANLLAERGLSINAAANNAGISREHLSKIRNDQRGLGPDVAAKLAPVLGLTVEQVVLPKAAEQESRRGFDRRLQSLADELEKAVKSQAQLARQVGQLRARVTRLEARPWPEQGSATGGH